MVVVVICGFGLCLWFMGLVCASSVLCLEKFMGWKERWRQERWDYFGFGDLWARDIEGDGDERKRKSWLVLFGRRRRLVASFLEKVSGEEIARNSFSNNLVLEGWLLIMSSLSLSSSPSILYFFWTFLFPTMASICSVWGRSSTSVLRKKMSVEGMHFGEREGRASGSGFRKVLLLFIF